MGGELDKRQHVGAMSGSFAPLPDGDPNPNFLCRSVAHSIQENVVPRCRSPYPAEPTYRDHISAARRAVPQPSFGAGDVSHGTYVREVAAGRIPARPAHDVVHAVRVTLFAQSLTQPYAESGAYCCRIRSAWRWPPLFTMWPDKTKARSVGRRKRTGVRVLDDVAWHHGSRASCGEVKAGPESAHSSPDYLPTTIDAGIQCWHDHCGNTRSSTGCACQQKWQLP